MWESAVVFVYYKSIYHKIIQKTYFNHRVHNFVVAK